MPPETTQTDQATTGPDSDRDASDGHDSTDGFHGALRFLNPIVFQSPQRLLTSAWVGHVPFAFWIVEAMHPRSIVELGTHTGVSYFAFCQAVERLEADTRCFAVDTWEGDVQTGHYGEDVFVEVSDYNRRYASFSSLVRSTFDGAVDTFPDQSIDLLHVDGLHTYQSVRRDFETWLPKLSERAVVLLHDTGMRKPDFGVGRLWTELSRSYGGFEFHHSGGLGVLPIGIDAPHIVRSLCELGDEANAVRSIYAQLGAHLDTVLSLRLDLHNARLDGTGRHELETLRAELEQSVAASETRVAESERRRRTSEQKASAQRKRAEVAELRLAEAELRLAEAELAVTELRETTWWRVGRPVRGLITWFRVRPPRTKHLSRGPSDRPLLVRVVRPFVPQRLRIALRRRFPAATSTGQPARSRDARLLPEDIALERFPSLRPLPVIPQPANGTRRLTMITDSLSAGSFYGGVGTSVILGVLLAQRLGASLRIVTRNERPEARNVAQLLKAHAVDYDGNIEFLHSSIWGNAAGVPLHADDLFLTTSWWSTWSALHSVDPERIVYLVQEDERLFYPAGDEQLMCSEVMADTRIRFVVNTSILRDYFVAEGFTNIGERGEAFEPAFPRSTYFRERSEGERRTFFFYARPTNVRNLFVRGLETVATGLRKGVLQPHEWEFHFVGKDIPRVALPFGVKPRFAENLPWQDYAALIRHVDVGLSLMSSPHPSYPPLDLAACGAVAVTNRFRSKTDLDRYSSNILCADPSTDALVEALAEAVELAADEARRTANYESSPLSRSWEDSMAGVVQGLAAAL